MRKKILIGILILVILVIIAIGIGILWYNNQLTAVDGETDILILNTKTVEIETGTSTEQILNLLYENNLIKNVFAAKIYIRLNNITGLQAGKYELDSSMSLEEILNQITSGEVVDEEITITFLEGKNMTWIAEKIAEETNNTEDDVYKLLEDEEYLQGLIDEYWFITDEILYEDIYYPLEGYLYPETYKFESVDVSVEDIFKKLLDQMGVVLTNYEDQITENGPSIHQILTMASIIELEGNDAESRAGISSVIYNRLKANMSLGSDVTTYYAIQVDVGERDLYTSEINTYNAYNTRGPNMEGKLPIGPIACVSDESINAALNPADTNYLYFVADINGNIYFSLDYEEHLTVIEELQKQGIWYEYDAEDDDSDSE